MDSIYIYITIVATIIYLIHCNYDLIDFILKINFLKCYNDKTCKNYLDKKFKYDN